jgi:hypothetical protein
MKISRKSFLASALLLPLGAKAFTLFQKKEKPMLVHHVFFWLKNPTSEADRAKLIEGLNSLRKIESLRLAKIGVPAATEKRDVIDNSYSISWLNFFDDVKGHDAYQVHPTHEAFVKDYAYLWSKVVVYDAQELA